MPRRIVAGEASLARQVVVRLCPITRVSLSELGPEPKQAMSPRWILSFMLKSVKARSGLTWVDLVWTCKISGEAKAERGVCGGSTDGGSKHSATTQLTDILTSELSVVLSIRADLVTLADPRSDRQLMCRRDQRQRCVLHCSKRVLEPKAQGRSPLSPAPIFDMHPVHEVIVLSIRGDAMQRSQGLACTDRGKGESAQSTTLTGRSEQRCSPHGEQVLTLLAACPAGVSQSGAWNHLQLWTPDFGRGRASTAESALRPHQTPPTLGKRENEAVDSFAVPLLHPHVGASPPEAIKYFLHVIRYSPDPTTNAPSLSGHIYITQSGHISFSLPSWSPTPRHPGLQDQGYSPGSIFNHIKLSIQRLFPRTSAAAHRAKVRRCRHLNCPGSDAVCFWLDRDPKPRAKDQGLSVRLGTSTWQSAVSVNARRAGLSTDMWPTAQTPRCILVTYPTSSRWSLLHLPDMVSSSLASLTFTSDPPVACF
ncbi:hypothetical protein LIA77_07454 [Sarocladium implicatum]|nr:hypothetical protein LIA77_07454 [Sarocladium implicatum]